VTAVLEQQILVDVGDRTARLRHEQLAGDGGERGRDLGLGHAVRAQLALHHVLPRGGVIEHASDRSLSDDVHALRRERLYPAASRSTTSGSPKTLTGAALPPI